MITATAVNIKRKTEIKMSSQNKVSSMKGNFVSCMSSLYFVVCVLPLEYYFLKLKELICMQCGVKVNCITVMR